jgi:hypothetical protein
MYVAREALAVLRTQRLVVCTRDARFRLVDHGDAAEAAGFAQNVMLRHAVVPGVQRASSQASVT